MAKPKSLLRVFLKRHQKEDTSLLFWSSNMAEYCKGRVIDFDDDHIIVRDYDEEREHPYELLLRIDTIAAIYPCLEQKEEDERFRNIMKRSMNQEEVE